MTARKRWIAWRNARLASARFQRFAARFPLTRPIARTSAARLFDRVTGFVHAQIIAAVVELDLLERAPLGADDIPELPRAAADRLLKAAAALDLLEALPDGRYALGSDGAALRANPGIAAMVAHHRLLYADLADPVALLKRGQGSLGGYWDYAGDGDSAPYSALMAASQPMVAQQLLDAYPFARHRRLLDVGGGEGAFLKAAATRHPHLKLALFDRPSVVARVDRPDIETTGGSFLDDPLPQGADLITLVRILHDHDDAPALTLLKAIHAALAPGGALVIAEPMAGTRGAKAMGDAYFGLYLFAMGSGRPRTKSEIAAMLSAAGFATAREHPTALPLIARVIAARKH